MSDQYFKDIVIDLVNDGIERKRILNYRVLQIPHLDFHTYIEFKNSNISILSNNCWGGAICFTLGIECLSPCKNLFFEDDDYIKFLQNLKYYIECEMKFSEYAFEPHLKQEYPVMLLDDIKVHCNHDTNPETAMEKWNRRKEKINYENILIEMYTMREDIMESFLKLKDYQSKICFVPFETNKKDAYYLRLYPGQNKFYETVNSNAGNGANSLLYNSLNMLLRRDAKRQTNTI